VEDEAVAVVSAAADLEDLAEEDSAAEASEGSGEMF
jgi:hypothetical protein